MMNVCSKGGSLAISDIEHSVNTVYETFIRIGEFLDGQKFRNITDIESVCVTMEHQGLRDLQIEIECPSGQVLVFQKFLGWDARALHMGRPEEFDGEDPIPGTGENYCWDDDAMNPSMFEWGNQNFVGLGIRVKLPEGDYQPYPLEDSSGMPLSESPMTSLVDCELNGEWTFRVVDNCCEGGKFHGNGYIFSWGINFDCDALVVE